VRETVGSHLAEAGEKLVYRRQCHPVICYRVFRLGEINLAQLIPVDRWYM
jgi:hypothetical protein